MKRISLIARKSGRIETELRSYKKVYENQQGYVVYEDKAGRLEVFQGNKKSMLNLTVEEVKVYDWYNDPVFNYILVEIYTEEDATAAFEKLKEETEKYIKEKYVPCFKLDNEAITLESEAANA